MPFLESFRAARWIRLANLVLQAVLFLTLFAGLNYLAGNHSWGRYDLTRGGRYSLSAETTAYLKNLASPVRIVVTTEEAGVNPELRGLLREYAYATADSPGKVTVEYLDVYQRHREAEQLGVDEPGVILLICNANHTKLTLDDLYRLVKGQRREFQGEQALTSAILEISSAARKRIYFLIGHGELRPDDVDATTGLSLVRDYLTQRDFDVRLLDLALARRIPDDAALLIAVAPRNPYQPFEAELLRQYLGPRANGRLILFLAPTRSPILPPSLGLENLLADWGVIADNDRIIDQGPENITEDDDLIIRQFTDHPVTQTLLSGPAPSLRIGPARSVRPDPARAAGRGLQVETLAATSTTAWGEVNNRFGGVLTYNPGVDVRALPGAEPPGRLGVIVASEPVPARDNLQFTVPRGRLIVFGTGDLIDNVRFANAGVLDLLMGAVNWMVNRTTQLAIAPHPIQRFELSLSERDLSNLRYSLLLALPGAAALLGLIVYWTRRH
jgi:hypothetical protein